MRIVFVLSLVVVGFAVSSCNTFIGMARDVQATGEGMEKVFRGERLDAPAEPPPPPPMQ